MATHDVPGHNPANHDKLAMGCWAEHDDGSLILVENTEGDRVIYSIFDPNQNPPVEYRDAMPAEDFKKTFSWKSGVKKSEKWLWHDKSAFPWDRVIKQGAKDGVRYTSLGHQIEAAQQAAQHHQNLTGQAAVPSVTENAERLSAAARVAEDLQLKAKAIDPERLAHLTPRQVRKLETSIHRLQQALGALEP